MAFPTNLNVLDKVFGIFSSKRKPLLQEDAIQFLLYFLNLLHEEVLSLMSLAPEDEKASNNGPWKTAGTNRRNIVLQETQGEQSPFTDIFVTMVRSDTLENGRSRTVSKESHLVIPLPIQGHKTLYECIDAFVAEEIITNSISKKTTFLSFPKSIIFGLKRFAYDPFVDRSIKLFDEVEYPEILVLERPMDKVPIKYQLSAIVEHIGKSPEGGHYLCYGRRFDGTWMLFDDDRVVKLADKEYLDKEAYLLLYNQITSFMPDED
ncbi:ubiquitin hydrolase B [Histomonas meleagridis]|uniref:ubiquitin hydrolase B n=1 Tax=Histomonas meleagridis TaxID=135588 RepID=UPI00355A7F06|nr:ubiquitin hydrolase B [Histomonas meleagridis]KAH0800899.1 ubiquitin hydrolase B [Histomonas meleagridis]